MCTTFKPVTVLALSCSGPNNHGLNVKEHISRFFITTLQCIILFLNFFLSDLSFAGDRNVLATTIFKVNTVRSTHCFAFSIGVNLTFDLRSVFAQYDFVTCKYPYILDIRLDSNLLVFSSLMQFIMTHHSTRKTVRICFDVICPFCLVIAALWKTCV